MELKIDVPAFIFKPVYSENITTEVIKRQNDVLKFTFPVFDKKDVLDVAKKLSLKKRKAHDRHIDDLLDIIAQIGDVWQNPNYDIRRETLEILPFLSGQSKSLCEEELAGTLALWDRKVAEQQLRGELGGKQYLEDWVHKGNARIHAQPRGVVLHNMAGNAFSLGIASLYYGLITKNVNMLKLSHGAPFTAIKVCESISDIDKKISKEIAALYWRGSRGDIYDDLFNSGNINCILAWGAIFSIEEIRRRANRYGIKIIDNGPKMSFSVVSEDIFQNEKSMNDTAHKMAIDIVLWNQKACLSPRVIYVIENPHNSEILDLDKEFSLSNSRNTDKKIFDDLFVNEFTFNKSDDFSVKNMMKRSIKSLKDSYSKLSTYGFAKMLAEGLKKAEYLFPRAHLTQADGMEILKKREYFFINYVVKNQATIITPSKNDLSWTVVYLRNLPSISEIDMCQDRFVIVSRILNIEELIHSIRKEGLQQYLQTISLFGSDQMVKELAEEFSLLGANRFPRVGEHNQHSVGMPWDGHYILQDMIKWVYIGFPSEERENKEGESISLFKGIKKVN